MPRFPEPQASKLPNLSDVAASAKYQEIQRVQAAYRQRLVDGWGIPEGARVLEVGCGQGDMTAMLARAVGANGHVTAVDIADPSYGAPLTLQQATDLLKATEEGKRIDFRFRFDVLEEDLGEFDVAVLAHSSWYFGDLDQLGRTLAKLRQSAPRLCFAEWDLQPRSLDQAAHLLAVLIQGQVEAFKQGSEANVRTPFSRTRLKALLEETGWRPIRELTVQTEGLQDADWEIQAATAQIEAPPKLKALIESQLDVLKELAKPGGNKSLDAYSIVAER